MPIAIAIAMSLLEASYAVSIYELLRVATATIE